MAIKYPNGKYYSKVDHPNSPPVEPKKKSYSNRGMSLEEDINETNRVYLTNNIAVIHKKPTPIQIVKVDYPHRSAAVIKEAYFKLASTTDYNGVYQGKYIDFEAKETSLKSIPLKNFHEHQINHMKQVLNQDGIAFILIRFTKFNEDYLLPAKDLCYFWERMLTGGRKSITRNEVAKCGQRIHSSFTPRIDYIKVIDELFFSKK